MLISLIQSAYVSLRAAPGADKTVPKCCKTYIQAGKSGRHGTGFRFFPLNFVVV